MYLAFHADREMAMRLASLVCTRPSSLTILQEARSSTRYKNVYSLLSAESSL
jgi:hypothetical protein